MGFLETISGGVSGDSFTNQEIFSGIRLWRIAHIENISDETGESVRELKVTLDSDLVFDWVSGWGTLSTIEGPPRYEWFFGDLNEDYTGHTKDANVGFIGRELFKFTPGLDVSRSFDKTIFTKPDTQTMTVTVTRREDWFERVLISVVAEANLDLVEATIISVSADCPSEIDPSGYYAEFGIPTEGIAVDLNTPFTITATIMVTPKVSDVIYKPRVGVSQHYQQEIYHSTIKGSSFSYTNEAGTWTVSAEGNYVWEWNYPSTSPLHGDITMDPECSSLSSEISGE